MKRAIALLLEALPPDARKAVEESIAWGQHTGQLNRHDATPSPIAGRRRRAKMQRIGGAQNWRCCHCGVRTNEATEPGQMASLDHIIPRALGGTHHDDNLVLACRACNSARGHNIIWTPPKETSP